MKRATFFLLICALCFSTTLEGQVINKKPLTTNDFAAWKVIGNPIISGDGKYSAFEINPQKGDGNLVVKSIDSKKEDLLTRGYAASFSPESDFIVYKIKQPADSVRSAKKRKLKKELMPKDSIGILVFKHHRIYSFPDLKQFSMPKENAKWVAFLTDMKKTKKKSEKEVNDPVEQKSQLVLFHPASGDTICFQNISEYYYAPLGHSITLYPADQRPTRPCRSTYFRYRNPQNKCDFQPFGNSKENNF